MGATAPSAQPRRGVWGEGLCFHEHADDICRGQHDEETDVLQSNVGQAGMGVCVGTATAHGPHQPGLPVLTGNPTKPAATHTKVLSPDHGSPVYLSQPQLDT